MVEPPVEIHLEFVYIRPLKHFKSNRRDRPLKKPTPRYRAQAPDIDNLIKFVFDACNAILCRYTRDNLSEQSFGLL